MKIASLLPTGLPAAAICLVSICLTPPQANATVTLEVYFENGEIPAGSLAVIVADTNADGFLPLSDPSVSGSSLSVGAFIGASDDRILALFSAVAGPEWFSGAGLGDLIPSLDYSAHGIVEGTPLVIYVFPKLSSPDSTFILGDEYIVYRNTESGGSGGDEPFAAPADPGVYTLAALTTSNGGTFDPTNLSLNETYLKGNTGTIGSGNPDDFGNSRNTATLLSNGNTSGTLDPGDLDFFEFQINQSTVFSANSTGDAPTQAWIFDEFGNVVYAPPGSGGGAFSISQTLGPGRYFLAIQGTSGSGQGNYELSSTLAPVISLESGSGMASGVLQPGNTDTFTFSLDGALIATLFTTGSLDTRGVLRDEANSILNNPDNDDDAGDQLNFRTSQLLSPGNYTVAISARNGGGAYDFNISTAPLPLPLALPPGFDNTVLKSKTDKKIKKMKSAIKKAKKGGNTSKAAKLKKKLKKLLALYKSL